MTAPDLKPCPWCGGEAEFALGKTGDDKDWHYIECSECEAMGPRVDYADHNIAIKDALTEAWNTRAPLAEAHPLAAEARMALERDDVAGWIGSLPKAPLAEALAAECGNDLEDATEEELLRELVRRNRVDPAPKSRTIHQYEVLVGIGKDNHCYIVFTDETDLKALVKEEGDNGLV